MIACFLLVISFQFVAVTKERWCLSGEGGLITRVGSSVTIVDTWLIWRPAITFSKSDIPCVISPGVTVTAGSFGLTGLRTRPCSPDLVVICELRSSVTLVYCLTTGAGADEVGSNAGV